MGDSIKKSHSFKSNFALTLLSIFSMLFFPMIWIGIMCLNLYFYTGLIFLLVGFTGSLISVIIFSRFKR